MGALLWAWVALFNRPIAWMEYKGTERRQAAAAAASQSPTCFAMDFSPCDALLL